MDRINPATAPTIRPVAAPAFVPAGVAAVHEAADPHDIAIIARGARDAATVTAHEGAQAASYSGELGEALDDMVTDEDERAEESRFHLVSLEEQSDGWIIAGWPIDVDVDSHAHVVAARVLPADVEEEETASLPTFMEWLVDCPGLFS